MVEMTQSTTVIDEELQRLAPGGGTC